MVKTEALIVMKYPQKKCMLPKELHVDMMQIFPKKERSGPQNLKSDKDITEDNLLSGRR